MFVIKPHPDVRIDSVKSIYCGNSLIGYCGAKAGKAVSLMYEVSESQRETIKELVTKECGEPSKVTGGHKGSPQIPKADLLAKPKPEPKPEPVPEPVQTELPINEEE